MAFDLTTIAFVISLVALIVATGQFLAQVFATADGYRRCQASVMGPWANRTRLKWRWTQFRFETLFTTPELVLEPLPKSYRTKNHGKAKATVINGDQTSLADLMIPDMQRQNWSDDLVCWVPLLQTLHQQAIELKKYVQDVDRAQPMTSNFSWPTVRSRERSWDFMPSEVLRPFASSNVSDIAIIARRLGMVWKDFRPGDGIMRAEGGPHVLSSIEVRGVGLVLQYKYRRPGNDAMRPLRQRWAADLLNENSSSRETYIWTEEADQFLFGILPGNLDLYLPSFEMGTPESCYATLERLHGKDSHARDTLRAIIAANPGWFFGFADLIPMAAPMIRQRGSTANKFNVHGYWAGLTVSRVGYLVYHQRLKEYMETNGAGTEQMQWLLTKYEYLKATHGVWWEGGHAKNPPLAYMEDLHNLYDEVTVYFQLLQAREEGSRIIYLDLLKTHLARAPSSYMDARARIDAGKRREHFINTGNQFWEGEAMHMYFDYIPDHVKYLKERGCLDETLVYEAWFTLIFRAFLWHRSHYLVEDDQPPLPSQDYGSQLPVYIG